MIYLLMVLEIQLIGFIFFSILSYKNGWSGKTSLFYGFFWVPTIVRTLLTGLDWFEKTTFLKAPRKVSK